MMHLLPCCARFLYLLSSYRHWIVQGWSQEIEIGESIISPSTEPLRNLGAWFDCHFNLNLHITKTCRSAFFHLLNIRRVRKYLRIESAEKLVHAFITIADWTIVTHFYIRTTLLRSHQTAAGAKRNCKSPLSSTTVLPYHTNIIQITLATCNV